MDNAKLLLGFLVTNKYSAVVPGKSSFCLLTQSTDTGLFYISPEFVFSASMVDSLKINPEKRTVQITFKNSKG